MLGVVPSDQLAAMIEQEIYAKVNKYRFEPWDDDVKNKVIKEVNEVLKKYYLDDRIKFNVYYNKQDKEINVYFQDLYSKNELLMN
jgi:hypothetical protein